MGRRAGRSPEATRRLLLDAAADLVRTRGLGASLDEMARAAGVSKGGLIYHFASKDELVLALAQDLLDEFREAVRTSLDPADTGPGRLTRAYVRACLDPAADERTARELIILTAQLMTSAEVAELARRDEERWAAELAEDGLPPDVVTLVRAAADGASSAPLWGGPAAPAFQRLREQLLALTREPGRWVG
ncbi:TetR/AcrR family transcriptional regulator [Desertihabitans aurantiacus]|uniref:TetR/AcrR family transcriptional regulator n=1 Tax=Desertihabitans aurantiacus TaxID=2282477 RepID=UPI000DF729BA|nr:TetR/AcrR family transcriptional regulator [Desertihabitans aurantiacus]